MRRLATLSAVSFALATLLFGCANPGPYNRRSGSQTVTGREISVFPIRRAKVPVIIDGKIDDWRDVKQVDFEDTIANPRKNKTTVAMCWDEKNLYLCFIVYDREIYSFSRKRDDATARDDAVAVLIDSHNDRTRQWKGDDIFYQVSLTEVVDTKTGIAGPRVTDHRGMIAGAPDYKWDGGLKVKVMIDGTLNKGDDLDNYYVVEMAIPWFHIGRRPQAGKTRFGMNLVVYDRDKNEVDYRVFQWKSTPVLLKPDSFQEMLITE